MSRVILFLILAFTTAACFVEAFSSVNQRRAVSVPRTPRFVSTAAAPVVSPLTHSLALQMSKQKESQTDEAEEGKKVEGAFYDDEVDTTPQKQGLSDSMRERLMAEASSGLDSDKKQTNVLLYIIGVVALLVILGGQGIFY